MAVENRQLVSLEAVLPVLPLGSFPPPILIVRQLVRSLEDEKNVWDETDKTMVLKEDGRQRSLSRQLVKTIGHKRFAKTICKIILSNPLSEQVVKTMSQTLLPK